MSCVKYTETTLGYTHVDQFWKKNTNQLPHSTNNHKNKTTQILITLLKRNPKPQPQKETNTKLKHLKIKKQKKNLAVI